MCFLHGFDRGIHVLDKETGADREDGSEYTREQHILDVVGRGPIGRDRRLGNHEYLVSLTVDQNDQFAYIGVYSSGIFGIIPRPGRSAPEGPSFEEQHSEILDNADLKAGLKLFWFATGKDDFLVETSRATVKMFQSHEFDVVYEEGEGGHTWDVWRNYLNEFAPKLSMKSSGKPI